MEKHTPGPWKWDHDELHQASLIDAYYAARERNEYENHPQAIVETDSGYYGPFGADRDLIAAAPDMLAALKEFRLKEEYVAGAQGNHLILRIPLDVIQKAAAAIAKAEGR